MKNCSAKIPMMGNVISQKDMAKKPLEVSRP